MAIAQDGLDERVEKRIRLLELPTDFKRASKYNICRILREREINNKKSHVIKRMVRQWVETESIIHHQCRYFDLPLTTKSAISICFSPDGSSFASTHGDHTVKIINFESGKIIQTLLGHPRTPWTVKFHPTNPSIVASGCLGYQIRVWDVRTGQCLYTAVLRHAIISICFHPQEDILAIASGNVLYTWEYKQSTPTIAWQSAHTLRCVFFPPSQPNKIILGEANEQHRSSQYLHSELTVKLSIWTFHLAWAMDSYGADHFPPRTLSEAKIILPHALLYNDGGFDVSTCGRYLAACADFSILLSHDELARVSRSTRDQVHNGDLGNVVGRVETLHLPFSQQDDETVGFRRVRARLSSRGRETLESLSSYSFNREPPPSTSKYSWVSLISLEGDQLGAVLRMARLAGSNAGGVTSVKLSPSSAYVLLGYGVRERQRNIEGSSFHRVTTVFRWEDMHEMSRLNSETDDVNIALFHPKEGYGYLYGTKQGKVRAADIRR